jgi:hypothetical protein
MAEDLLQLLGGPLESFLTLSVDFSSKIVVSVILLAIGWVIGTIIGRITKELMIRLKVDSYIAKKTPVFKLSDIFPTLFEWIVYLVFIQAAVGVLEIPALGAFIQTVINFLPGLIGSVLVVVIGYVIAEYVKGEVELSKIAYSDIMANVLFWLIVYVAIALALPMVGINATLVNSILLIIVGSFGIGMAIAIGLGLKDVIRDIAKRKTRRLVRR